ncbi:MAG: hypothetical protein JJE21_05930 [Spirochaetaceae bacterium]|nr:hypothetical protein [Spirochaetaceae bacterium]
MLLKQADIKSMDSLTFHSAPDETTGIIKNEQYKVGPYVVKMLKNPLTRSGENLVDIQYSLAVLKNNKLVLAVNMERDDYRGLAELFRCSIKSIQEDNKTRNYYGPLKCVVYSAEEKEDQGIYEGEMDIMSLRVYMMDVALDALDCIDEIENL